MAYEYDFAIADFLDEFCDVLSQYLYLIGSDLLRFVAEIITAHIRCDDAIVLTEHRYLMPPPIPKLRETMQQYDHLATPLLHIVEPDAVYVDEV